MSKIIAFSSNKGGILKTTTAVNTAIALTKKGKKVLLVDTDNQANVTSMFGDDVTTFKEKDIYQVLVKGKDINSFIVNKAENLDVLPSSEDMGFFESDVARIEDEYDKKYGNSAFILKEELKKINKQYDYILIDTPPSAGLIIMNVYCAAQEIVVPVHPVPASKDSLINTFVHVEDIKSTANPSLKISHVLPTKVKANTTVHKKGLKDIQEFCVDQGITFASTQIRESVLPDRAVEEFTLPLLLTPLKGTICDDFIAFAEEVE